MDSFINETKLQVNKENEENDQWGEIHKLVNIFKPRNFKSLKIISFQLNNPWLVKKMLLQKPNGLVFG